MFVVGLLKTRCSWSDSKALLERDVMHSTLQTPSSLRLRSPERRFPRLSRAIKSCSRCSWSRSTTRDDRRILAGRSTPWRAQCGIIEVTHKKHRWWPDPASSLWFVAASARANTQIRLQLPQRGRRRACFPPPRCIKGRSRLSRNEQE